MLDVRPEGRDRRLVGALLVLGVTALFFVVVGQIASVFFYFGDIFLTFFLAWLLAFIISPVVTRIVDAVPRLPRAVAAVIVYTLVVVVMALTVVVAAGALALLLRHRHVHGGRTVRAEIHARRSAHAGD